MKDLEFGKDPELIKTEGKAGSAPGNPALDKFGPGALEHGKQTPDVFGGNIPGGNSIRGRGRGKK